MRKQLLSLNLIASGLLITSAASAKPVTVKDWSLDDSGASCVASTSRTVNGQQYRFEISVDKSGLFPAEAWVREVPGSATTKAFKLITEDRTSQSFGFTPLQDADGNVVFWQVPVDTDSLISYVKRQTRLRVYALIPNGSKAATVDFSLRGSSAVVDSLISQCGKNKSITQRGFEKDFVPAHIAQLDPLRIDEVETAKLRALYQSSLASNAQKINLQKELTGLNTQYAKLIQELSKVNGSLDQLTQKELAALQAKKASLEAKIQSLDLQIANQEADILNKESEVAPANAAYEAAWNILAPIEPEHKRLASDLAASQGDLSRSQARLADIDQSVQDKSAAIRAYENEVSNLRTELSNAEYQASRARTDVQNTQEIYRRFQPRREKQERVVSHPVARYCQQNRTNLCENLVYKVQRDADSEVDMIERVLSGDVEWARQIMSTLDNRVYELNSRIRNIYDYDIPNLRAQVSDLTSQRPGVEQSVAAYRSSVSAKKGALQAYDNSVGYAAKKADFDAKSAVVVNLRNELARLEREKSASIRSRELESKNLLATEKNLELVLAKIQEGQDRSSELSKALEPYFNQKAGLDAAIAQLDGAIQSNKQEFAKVVSSN